MVSPGIDEGNGPGSVQCMARSLASFPSMIFSMMAIGQSGPLPRSISDKSHRTYEYLQYPNVSKCIHSLPSLRRVHGVVGPNDPRYSNDLLTFSLRASYERSHMGFLADFRMHGQKVHAWEFDSCTEYLQICIKH